MVITDSKSIDQPGKVANSARDQLNRLNDFFLVLVRACKFGLARWVRPSRPAAACSFSTLRLNLVLAHGIPPDFRATSIYLNRHQISPEFIGSRNCVPMAFTAESPPAQGQ